MEPNRSTNRGFQKGCCKVKKKIISIAVASAILLASLIIYIMPNPLSDCFGESSQITITLNEIGISDGEPFIDPVTYPDITEEQKDSIFALCDQYSYRRTFHTIFSDGSLSGLGTRLLWIYINGEDSTVHHITISSTGKIAIGNKTYEMDNAHQFIEQIGKILAKPS